MDNKRPHLAIIDPNTLAALGLRQLLMSFMPMMEVDTFGSVSELAANHPEQYAHYFAAMNVVLENMAFFNEFKRKTIVLTMSTDGSRQLSDFHCICVNVPEKELVRSLLIMEQHGHGRPMPAAHHGAEQPALTNREAEVMTLIVQGYINKEIADQLHIGLATVITHRKNIMEKLGLKSVSALTIYAVMHGYVDINKI